MARMVGRPLRDYYAKRQIRIGGVALEAIDLRSDDGRLRPTSLCVREGEILGVAGLVGSGKAELGLALGGAIPCSGTVRVAGKSVTLGDPRSSLSGGIGFVPDDRKRAALLPTRSVSHNFSIAWGRMIAWRGLIRMREEQRAVSSAIKRYGVVTSSPTTRITNLSGGNQQKVVVGRIFALGVKVLVLSEPTRGISVGAKSDIYRLMQEAAASGAGVIFISSELPELIGLADRMIVFFHGEIRGQFQRHELREELLAHVAVTGSLPANGEKPPFEEPS